MVITANYANTGYIRSGATSVPYIIPDNEAEGVCRRHLFSTTGIRRSQGNVLAARGDSFPVQKSAGLKEANSSLSAGDCATNHSQLETSLFHRNFVESPFSVLVLSTYESEN